MSFSQTGRTVQLIAPKPAIHADWLPISGPQAADPLQQLLETQASNSGVIFLAPPPIQGAAGIQNALATFVRALSTAACRWSPLADSKALGIGSQFVMPRAA